MASPDTYMRRGVLLASSLVVAYVSVACSRDVNATATRPIDQQYGLAGTRVGDVVTLDNSFAGAVVPVTLADGRRAQLVIPGQTQMDPRAASPYAYAYDQPVPRPVPVQERVIRQDVVDAPAPVQRRVVRYPRKRTWEQEALIIGGSAGAGTAIGAIAGGKKGAAVGATVGGVSGLIYDLATRNR